MKKSSIRFLSLLLALVLVLALGAFPVLAADCGHGSCEESSAVASTCIKHVFQKIYYGSYIDENGNTVHLYQYTCIKCGYSYIA